MPLSLIKLQEFIRSKNFEINKYFVLDGYLFFMELFCKKNAETFLLYIPSKYVIEVKKDKTRQDFFELKNIDIETIKNIVDDYAQQPNIESLYNSNVAIIPDQDIEQHLENNYRKEIKISQISENDNQILKSLYRQINRLKYSVQNIPYKLSIFFKNYFLPIRRDDSIDIFFIKKFDNQNNYNKKIMVIVDLETLYEKDEFLFNDVKTVKESIYNVLEKNQSSHIKMFEKIIDNKKNVINLPFKVGQKNRSYDFLINKLELMLIKSNNREQKIRDNLIKINDSISKNINNDILKIHEKTTFHKDLKDIIDIKNEIISTINILREKKENTILIIDKIMFDNTVMFDTMTKNFSLLKDFF